MELSETPFKVPRRLRERLHKECKMPSTVEEIEAKLRNADLRRQEFYEEVLSKARSKPRSLFRVDSHEKDLGQRLEAKLQTAAQNRLSILAEAKKRLARLDELRQAAKTAVELRFEKEHWKLSSKVESRAQQAEANRKLIFEAYLQRKKTLKERSSQSLLRKVALENKYKERVLTGIHQKRLAAEKKRLKLLEAEKSKAHARVLQVQQVYTSILHQREVNRRRLRDQLEDRLQRAKRQRAEYLRQRGCQHNDVTENWSRWWDEQAYLLSTKLAWNWRRFVKKRKTSINLAKAFIALNINGRCARSLPFEQLDNLIESTDTIQTMTALLNRLESRFKLLKTSSSTKQLTMSSLGGMAHLLIRVTTPKSTPKKVSSVRKGTRSPAKLSRYPVRIFLCAYMIVGYPDLILRGQGECESALSRSAQELIKKFELLLRIIIEGPIRSLDEESNSSQRKQWSFRFQLANFDKAWYSYLNCFAVWQVKEAQSLEKDLVRAACELSVIQKFKPTLEGNYDSLHDLNAIQKQVTKDQKEIRQMIKRLSGEAGIGRMECSLSEIQSKYLEAKENGYLLGSLIGPITAPATTSSTQPGASFLSFSDTRTSVIDDSKRSNSVVRSKVDNVPPSESFGSAISWSSYNEPDMTVTTKELPCETEVIANEFLHDMLFADEDRKSLNTKMRETREKAFWDGIIESIEQDKLNYDQIVQLMRVVRDETCKLAPESWKEDIYEAIDLDALSQILESGNLDIDFLGKTLEFTLATLQNLSSPASDEMKATQQNLLKELDEICQSSNDSKRSSAFAMIKGMRFVFQRIQALKTEMSTARLRLFVPFLKGNGLFQYLREAFANRYGSPSRACTSLPMTLQWFASVFTSKDQEWIEHLNFLSLLSTNESSSQNFLPSTVLRTGGHFLAKTSTRKADDLPFSSQSHRGYQLPECDGEIVSLLVRLGLLELLSNIGCLVQELFPETLTLNFARLIAVQDQVVKNIVTSTSILVCRQTLLSERVILTQKEMESILLKCTTQLLDLLDRVDEVSVEKAVDMISNFATDCDNFIDANKLQMRKLVMAGMLVKSLQTEDIVFEKVSRAVYLATRGVLLGGNGPTGRKLADMALRPVGAVAITDRVVEAAEMLGAVADISVAVHEPWYRNITESL